MADKITSIEVGYCEFTRSQADELIAIMDTPGWAQLMRMMKCHRRSTAWNTLGNPTNKTLSDWGFAQGQYCEAGELMALRAEMNQEYQDFVDSDKDSLT